MSEIGVSFSPSLPILFCDADLTLHTIREMAGYAKHTPITSVSFLSVYAKTTGCSHSCMDGSSATCLGRWGLPPEFYLNHFHGLQNQIPRWQIFRLFAHVSGVKWTWHGGVNSLEYIIQLSIERLGPNPIKVRQIGWMKWELSNKSLWGSKILALSMQNNKIQYHIRDRGDAVVDVLCNSWGITSPTSYAWTIFVAKSIIVSIWTAWSPVSKGLFGRGWLLRKF